MLAKTKLKETRERIKELTTSRKELKRQLRDQTREINAARAKAAKDPKYEYDFEMAGAEVEDIQTNLILADKKLIQLEAAISDLELAVEVEKYEASIREAFAMFAEIGDNLEAINERLNEISFYSPTGYRPSNDFFDAVYGGVRLFGSLGLDRWVREYRRSLLYTYIQELKEVA